MDREGRGMRYGQNNMREEGEVGGVRVWLGEICGKEGGWVVGRKNGR